MVYAIGSNFGYYNYANNWATRPNVAFRGEEKTSWMKVKDNENDSDKKNADSAAGLMLGGGVLATLSATALYFLTRGKGGKAVTEVAEKAITKTTNSVKINPEVKFIEKIEKGFSKFKDGQELALQNGGKRVDKFEGPYNISRYYDKSGKLTKKVIMNEDGWLAQIDRFGKNGELKSTIERTDKSGLMHKKYDKKGRIESIVGREYRKNFSYMNYDNGDIEMCETLINSKGSPVRTIRTLNKKNGARQRYTSDREAKTTQYEWFNKDENCLYHSEIRDVSKIPAGVLKSKTTHTIVRDSGGYPEKVLIEETGKAPREVDYEDYLEKAGFAVS